MGSERDPLKLADKMDESNLHLSRAAGLKHGRGALLATAGWAWAVGLGANETQQSEYFGADCSLMRCPTGDDPRTRRVDETDCSNRTLPSGVTSAPGNKCHVDCSNRGLCDYALGKCTCFEGCEFVFLAAANVRKLIIVASPPILGVQVLRG